MLSIGLFTYSSKPRGSVVHAAALAEALLALGHRVTLYALSKPGDAFFRELRCPLRLIPAGSAPSATDELVRQRVAEFTLGLRALTTRHDVYHAEDCLSASALLGAQSFGVGPVVRTVHHVEHFESPYLAECQRRSIEGADLVLSVSELTRREVKLEFSRASRLVRNGIDPLRFSEPAPACDDDLAARFGIRPDDLVLLSVGGVEQRKNSLRALEAVARAHPRHSRLRWLIAGGASLFDHSAYAERFEARLLELAPELRACIVRTGTLSDDELNALYRRSDVLLCPSEKEGFGLCVLEAMAANTAVVVSARAPFTEYLDANSACLVDPLSISDITEGLSRVLGDAAYRAELAERGRALSTRFSWRQTAEEHVRHYLALSQAQRRPAQANS